MARRFSGRFCRGVVREVRLARRRPGLSECGLRRRYPELRYRYSEKRRAGFPCHESGLAVSSSVGRGRSRDGGNMQNQRPNAGRARPLSQDQRLTLIDDCGGRVRVLLLRRRVVTDQARDYRSKGQLVPASLVHEITDLGTELRWAVGRYREAQAPDQMRAT
jgi:hypothetical protein